MDGPNRDGWLVVVGLIYPVVAFGVLLGCGGWTGPMAFHPLTVPVPAALLAAVTIALWADGVRFRGRALALFVVWLLAVVSAQWVVYAAAAAAV
ncbi:hypothetical protein GobsT_13380 [Gemmata obscuriglobus]|uniref:Uncharacterized protein n=1 Tax=Gemmata obscuriglobus TaxID=114 RepID=A0A2Z3HB78_9BACT|nr:hypothetical protein [Gemmata obscuriglobus]AWM40215.1 hypothetical protein C1280_26560 [Gemmata obscuriglobus]QEG26595.1 hypothetical protein GobsT_13380 [Gemmata obscuriglobus]VTS02074.1 unnamed protein product [Gemmata obscuriglobus UQM 2246]